MEWSKVCNYYYQIYWESNPSVQQSQSEIAPGELKGVAGGGGELCLEGETDTGISVFLKCMFLYCMFFCGSLCTVCSHSSGSAHSYGCVVNGPSASYVL